MKILTKTKCNHCLPTQIKCYWCGGKKKAWKWVGIRNVFSKVKNKSHESNI